MSTPGLEFPEFLPPATVPAGRLQALGSALEPYEASLRAATTNPTLGTGGFFSGWFSQRGAWIDVIIHVQFGTSDVNAGSGIYFFPLPVHIDTSFYGSRHAIGSATLRDDSAGSISAGTRLATVLVRPTATDEVDMRFPNDGSGTGSPAVAQNSPWDWAANDQILAQFSYVGDF